MKNEDGMKTGLIVGDYFRNNDGEIEEWIFGAAPKDMTDRSSR